MENDNEAPGRNVLPGELRLREKRRLNADNTIGELGAVNRIVLWES